MPRYEASRSRRTERARITRRNDAVGRWRMWRQRRFASAPPRANSSTTIVQCPPRGSYGGGPLCFDLMMTQCKAPRNRVTPAARSQPSGALSSRESRTSEAQTSNHVFVVPIQHADDVFVLMVRQEHIHPFQRNSCRLLNLGLDPSGNVAVVCERHSRVGCSHRGLDHLFVCLITQLPKRISLLPLSLPLTFLPSRDIRKDQTPASRSMSRRG